MLMIGNGRGLLKKYAFMILTYGAWAAFCLLFSVLVGKLLAYVTHGAVLSWGSKFSFLILLFLPGVIWGYKKAEKIMHDE